MGSPTGGKRRLSRGWGRPAEGAGANKRWVGHLACELSVEGQEGGCDWAFTLERKGTGVDEKKHFLWRSGRASHWGFPTRGRRPWPPSRGRWRWS